MKKTYLVNTVAEARQYKESQAIHVKQELQNKKTDLQNKFPEAI